MSVMKVGGSVPVTLYAFYVLKKPLNPKETNLIGHYDVGKIVVFRSSEYSKLGAATKSLLARKFRKADALEATKKLEEICKNAVIGAVYEDGECNIFRFYVPNNKTKEVLQSYDGFQDCVRDVKIYDLLTKALHLSKEEKAAIGRVSFGKLNGEFYFFSEFDNSNDVLLKFGSPMDKEKIPKCFEHTRKQIEVNYLKKKSKSYLGMGTII